MCTVAQVLSEYQGKPGFDPHKIADQLDIRYSSLMRIMNPHDSYDLGVRKLIPFLQATKDLTLLDHIEAHFGRMTVCLKAADGCSLDFPGVCKFLKEAGEAMSALSDAVSDGRITRAEASRCRKEITELMQVCMAILGKLNEIEEG